MFNLNKIISLPIFIKHMNLFFAKKKKAPITPQKSENGKKEMKQISTWGGVKNVKGVFVTDNTGLKIFVFINAMKFASICKSQKYQF